MTQEDTKKLQDNNQADKKKPAAKEPEKKITVAQYNELKRDLNDYIVEAALFTCHTGPKGEWVDKPFLPDKNVREYGYWKNRADKMIAFWNFGSTVAAEIMQDEKKRPPRNSGSDSKPASEPELKKLQIKAQRAIFLLTEMRNSDTLPQSKRLYSSHIDGINQILLTSSVKHVFRPRNEDGSYRQSKDVKPEEIAVYKDVKEIPTKPQLEYEGENKTYEYFATAAYTKLIEAVTKEKIATLKDDDKKALQKAFNMAKAYKENNQHPDFEEGGFTVLRQLLELESTLTPTKTTRPKNTNQPVVDPLTEFREPITALREAVQEDVSPILDGVNLLEMLNPNLRKGAYNHHIPSNPLFDKVLGPIKETALATLDSRLHYCEANEIGLPRLLSAAKKDSEKPMGVKITSLNRYF